MRERRHKGPAEATDATSGKHWSRAIGLHGTCTLCICLDIAKTPAAQAKTTGLQIMFCIRTPNRINTRDLQNVVYNCRRRAAESGRPVVGVDQYLRCASIQQNIVANGDVASAIYEHPTSHGCIEYVPVNVNARCTTRWRRPSI